MNLRIKCRFLGVTNKMVLCKKCSSPVTEAMVPRFAERFEGRYWTCSRPGCQNQNAPDRSRCTSCNKSLPMSEVSALQESVFGRFERATAADIARDELGAEDGKGQRPEISIEKLVKRKGQLNSFMYILERLPRFDRNSSLTFRQTLRQ